MCLSRLAQNPTLSLPEPTQTDGPGHNCDGDFDSVFYRVGRRTYSRSPRSPAKPDRCITTGVKHMRPMETRLAVSFRSLHLILKRESQHRFCLAITGQEPTRLAA
jgi:hypothetical protein